ncbi:MAG: peptide chain release factor N(5)-glutamine methyltransferase [Prevotella sp.]|nr:peptide chain release factor N(5)-glutamine methyltransferase [Prevotella sp.]
MTYSDLWRRLTPLYDEGEAKAMVRLLLERCFGLTLADIYGGGLEASGINTERLEQLMRRLEQSEPVQYAIGEELFCGRWFRVTPAVLIPRPETQELCEWCLGSLSPWRGRGERPHILDIGTGSGCIAITLAAEVAEARVTAWDISEEALTIARENAQHLGAQVTFEQVDILAHAQSSLQSKAAEPSVKFKAQSPRYDIIISNPPYIAKMEAEQMTGNVLDWEPHGALFVPDDDPLLFYRAIARLALSALKPQGLLFLEINPLYHDELMAMLRDMGFADVETRNDQFNKQRMIKAVRQ